MEGKNVGSISSIWIPAPQVQRYPPDGGEQYQLENFCTKMVVRTAQQQISPNVGLISRASNAKYIYSGGCWRSL
jgi:hypothetical protein